MTLQTKNGEDLAYIEQDVNMMIAESKEIKILIAW